MNRIEELITAQRNELGKVCVCLNLNGRIIKSPFVPATQVPRLLCRTLANQIERLVRQRKRQIAMGYCALGYAAYEASFNALEYRLSARARWNAANLKKYIRALLPDLHNIAPHSGRYATTWNQLLIGLELLLQEDAINAKLNSLMGYE